MPQRRSRRGPVEPEPDPVTRLEAARDARIGEREGHRHRRPVERGNGLVAERHRIGRDPLDLARRLVQRGFRRRRGDGRRCRTAADRPRLDSRQARLGIDQELPRDDDVLAGRQAGKDLGLAACLAADADLGGMIAPVACGQHDERAPARADHRFARHQQRRLGIAAKRDAGEHENSYREM